MALVTPRRIALALTTSGCIALTGCGHAASTTQVATATTPSAAPTNSATATITIHNFHFNPASLQVRSGTKITVVNQDSTAHTVTATGAKTFDTATIAAGKTAVFTAPTKHGEYPYICSIHQFMHGTLAVTP